MSAPVAGPFGTEREAAESPAVQAIFAGTGGLREGNRQLFRQALDAAGVELGAYDARIIAWLAGYEPQMCAVVAGLITRAAEGQADAGTAERAAITQLARDCGATGRGDEGPAVPFADLIERYRQGQRARVLDAAALSVVLDALDVAASHKRDLTGVCGDCQHYPAGQCTACESRIAAAESYDELYARLDVTR